MRLIRFLVVRANGDMRIVTRRPRLSVDEFAYKLTVNVPDAPAFLGEIELTIPEWPAPGDATLRVEEANGRPAMSASSAGGSES